LDSYAIRPGGLIYHIVPEGEDRTVCGIRALHLKFSPPLKRNGMLYIVADKPQDRALCKHCERLREENKELEEPEI
jgi:hypothetical protein